MTLEYCHMVNVFVGSHEIYDRLCPKLYRSFEAFACRSCTHKIVLMQLTTCLSSLS
jgi:hypothetical protein